ncbi:NAD(P)H-dependent oxidoreductase subunit E [Sphaerochaeta sp. PS]|uniref:NADH-quinone oxidoreductase subunit NuoE family protein n=1 Tax=Sphaerochaeta sp. PS TaxID=3076336 RepID=UPI0028A4D3D3|nr:NAD(P)H-dependent oxidoreductase subunit E [Sphaerochaeta sp. PS]MDT4761182.1 NAD(P)H-dependent oxidoreductase subunit E [Sphaerochaeta sp. PS]
MSETNENKFSPELISFIEEWKDKPGNLIMVLHKVQEEQSYISREAADTVAAMLDVPLATIWGVVSFYHFFKLTKPGEHNIQVCLGTACYLKGAQPLIDELGKLLKLEIGGVTDDGLFSLEAVRCVGCCGLAPVLTVGGEVFGKVTKDQIAGIIAKYK